MLIPQTTPIRKHAYMPPAALSCMKAISAAVIQKYNANATPVAPPSHQVVIAHAATSSSDNYAKVLGIQWTAKEALNLLHRLTCFPGTAEALLSQNTLPILFAALAKYTAKPAGQQSSTGADAMASQGAHGPAASVPAPQATAANRPVSGGNPNTPPSSKNPTSKQQTPRDGPSVPTAQVDAEPGPKPGTPPAEPQPSASGTPPTEVGDTAGQAKTPLDDLKPANSHDLHCRPEAVLACRAVVNLCQYFAEDAEVRHLDMLCPAGSSWIQHARISGCV